MTKQSNPHTKRQTLGDTLANLIGEAVTDIRQSVVEEGWFGRKTTATPNFYDSMWGRHGHFAEPDQRDRSPDRSPDIDH